ncbi:hypothetical protein AVEN_267398-1 [Araneus ventricosus]|uniref:Uncharacterized protein n=1 Tax=Araneus ventricosus TaxID=182803 RepID=A0A4Y2NP37_ARAVE|nr:hypothetical protein AVEN_45720-1 [Araneus ventricosus]GBN39517.1 hypothetical protein AVEN_267398-1 [Araneus ventricosus]
MGVRPLLLLLCASLILVSQQSLRQFPPTAHTLVNHRSVQTNLIFADPNSAPVSAEFFFSSLSSQRINKTRVLKILLVLSEPVVIQQTRYN